ncbi:hypothetical protein K474DRAFT_1712591 [Panus rudis PR-1116 ss-1]|nr:hypothetical protein K474DRAFT_1712591 [Panus rudis PR-1116 ss-1]
MGESDSEDDYDKYLDDADELFLDDDLISACLTQAGYASSEGGQPSSSSGYDPQDIAESQVSNSSDRSSCSDGLDDVFAAYDDVVEAYLSQEQTKTSGPERSETREKRTPEELSEENNHVTRDNLRAYPVSSVDFNILKYEITNETPQEDTQGYSSDGDDVSSVADSDIIPSSDPGDIPLELDVIKLEEMPTHEGDIAPVEDDILDAIYAANLVFFLPQDDAPELPEPTPPPFLEVQSQEADFVDIREISSESEDDTNARKPERKRAKIDHVEVLAQKEAGFAQRDTVVKTNETTRIYNFKTSGGPSPLRKRKRRCSPAPAKVPLHQ